MAARTDASAAILVLTMEFLGLGLVILVAGINDQIGKVVMIMMGGLLLLTLISQADIIAGAGRIFNSYLGNPSNKTK